MEGSIRNIISDLDNSSNKYKHNTDRVDSGDIGKYSESTTTVASKTPGMVSQSLSPTIVPRAELDIAINEWYFKRSEASKKKASWRKESSL